MNLRKEIEGTIKFNPYNEATEKVVDLCKQWALEMIPKDKPHQYSLNQLKKYLRDRINNE